jgi:hypothetical protein
LDPPMLKSKLCSFPAISLLVRGWGWVGGWGKAENKAKLSPAGAGSWAELGKNNYLGSSINMPSIVDHHDWSNIFNCWVRRLGCGARARTLFGKG